MKKLLILSLLLLASCSSQPKSLVYPSGATEGDIKTAYMVRLKERFAFGISAIKPLIGDLKARENFGADFKQSKDVDLQCIDDALALHYSPKERHRLYVGAYNIEDGYDVELEIVKRRYASYYRTGYYFEGPEPKKSTQRALAECVNAI